VDEGKAGIVFVHADLEDAHDFELLQPRHDARGRDLALRCDQDDALAHARPDRGGQLAAQHDAETPRLQGIEASGFHVAADFRHLVLGRRQDAAHDGALHALLVRNQALRHDVGRGGLHVRVLRRHRRHLLPVAQRAAQADDLHVGGNAEDARAQLLLEAVHDRQHHDQRRHPERDAQHRGDRDE
jgi:hypothetical protein